jgi:hypothetical protein
MKKLIFVAFIMIWPSLGQTIHDEYEDVYNRHNGPPLYRYHDRLYHQENSYQNPQYETDANEYWGNRYHGNEDPNRQYEHFLDRAIGEMEDNVNK